MRVSVHGVFRHGDAAHRAGRVGDGDAEFGGGLNVDVVHTRAHLADHLDIRPRLHEFPRDGGEPGGQRARARGLLAQGGVVEGFRLYELIPLMQVFLHEGPARGLRKGALIHA